MNKFEEFLMTSLFVVLGASCTVLVVALVITCVHGLFKASGMIK